MYVNTRIIFLQGKERTVNLPVQLQKSSDESAENKSIISKIILDLQVIICLYDGVFQQWSSLCLNSLIL